MERVLITGANGFLGQHLCRHLSKKRYEVLATGRGTCRMQNHHNVTYITTDLTDEEQVCALLNEWQPSVIIHNAALSKPDECRENKQKCVDINVQATKYLLRHTKAYFIYISTDFIFGEDGPHGENTPPCPLNFYGESKFISENLVERSGLNYCIVRPVFIYGPAWEGLRPTFLHWVKANLEQGKKIKVVSDQQRTPTFVSDICSGVEQIIERRCTGAFHLAGKDVLSPYQMALATARELGLDASLIEEVTSDSFPEPVRRAKKSGLSIQKAGDCFGYKPVAFEDGVRMTFATTRI